MYNLLSVDDLVVRVKLKQAYDTHAHVTNIFPAHPFPPFKGQGSKKRTNERTKLFSYVNDVAMVYIPFQGPGYLWLESALVVSRWS